MRRGGSAVDLGGVVVRGLLAICGQSEGDSSRARRSVALCEDEALGVLLGRARRTNELGDGSEACSDDASRDVVRGVKKSLELHLVAIGARNQALSDSGLESIEERPSGREDPPEFTTDLAEHSGWGVANPC